MPDLETQNQGAWTTYEAHQIARGIELPEPDRWAWDILGAGSGAEVFGDVQGLRVLDLGSGLGRHAARMASLGAQVTTVDSSPTPHKRATDRYPAVPAPRLECADAVAHLRDADPFDLVHSISSVPYPRRLLPALADCVRPGGRLLVSAPSPPTVSMSSRSGSVVGADTRPGSCRALSDPITRSRERSGA
ncbi:class I SAM-dependent methyltransferase [Streptomyces sp. CRN 30]|uniref:class I SAM-dependent methyltransferase n=1 Tax=Streptomyces sp. CRN 30 TaxID=3075613 RepID=UPI002A7FE51E|nr:class I SAM-dependent methyltransferase [Streptomyces sp. CRN 30]